MLKRKLLMTTLLSVIASAAFATSNLPTVKDVSNVTWQNSPNSPAKMAVMKGDPDKSGYYVVWVKIPPNYTSKPHYHDQDVDSIVITGNSTVTLTDNDGNKKTITLKKDQFLSVPPNVTHIVKTGNKGMIVQNSGMGPMKSTYIN